MNNDLIDENICRELSPEERLEYLLGRCHALEQNLGRLISALQESDVVPSLNASLEFLIDDKEGLRKELKQETNNMERRGYLASTIETGKTLKRRE